MMVIVECNVKLLIVLRYFVGNVHAPALVLGSVFSCVLFSTILPSPLFTHHLNLQVTE